MLKAIIERFVTSLVDSDTRSIDKALHLIVIALYTSTAVQLQKYTYILETFISSGNRSGLNNQVLLTLIESILAIAGYFLLIEIAGFFHEYASNIVTAIRCLLGYILHIDPKSKVDKTYKYDRNIVRKYDVERWLEVNQDDRIKARKEQHDKIISSIMGRKRELMAISAILAINFYINHEKFNLVSYNARIYWFIIIGLALWSTLLPYNDMMYMYIHNNKIRD